MSDLIPVWLNVRQSDGVISVCMLLETPVGLALVDGEPYKRIGQVRNQTRVVKNQRVGSTTKQNGFQWYFDEEQWGASNGWEPTRTAAIRACLRAGGYIEAPPNAANGGLF